MIAFSCASLPHDVFLQSTVFCILTFRVDTPENVSMMFASVHLVTREQSARQVGDFVVDKNHVSNLLLRPTAQVNRNNDYYM